MTRARSSIDLKALGIDTDMKGAVNGSYLIEILNKDGGGEKADLLYGRMKAVLEGDPGVRGSGCPGP